MAAATSPYLSDMTCDEKLAWAKSRRDASFAKVDPPLQGVPDTLPLNSMGLPKTVLTPREIEITEKYNIVELLRALRQRDVSVEEVTRAFLRRAALAQAAVSLDEISDNNTKLMTADKLPHGTPLGPGHRPR